LFSAPHNAGDTGYTRVASWKEVREYFGRLDSRFENRVAATNVVDVIRARA
jgi:hypothetical protein